MSTVVPEVWERMISSANRGDVWLADLEPVEGHEQGGTRPCLVLSDDLFNHGPAGLVVVLPLTSRGRGIQIRVLLDPPEGGVKVRSYIMPEMIRSISTRRLRTRWGMVGPTTLAAVEKNVKVLLGI